MNKLTKVVDSDAGVARWRTAALALVSGVLVWVNNAWGVDIVDELAEWLHVSESTVNLALLWLVAQALYWLSQRSDLVDKLAHIGLAAHPDYDHGTGDASTERPPVDASPAHAAIPEPEQPPGIELP